MSTTPRPPTYTSGFRVDAIKRIIAGTSVRELAAELQVSEPVLHLWIQTAQRGGVIFPEIEPLDDPAHEPAADDDGGDMAKKKRQTYSDDVRNKALAAMRTKTVPEVAREMKLADAVLYRWRRQDSEDSRRPGTSAAAADPPGRKKRQPHPPEVRQRALDLARTGKPGAQVARELGLDKTIVNDWIRAHFGEDRPRRKLPDRPKAEPGKGIGSIGMGKATPEQRLEAARQVLDMGRRRDEIGAELGVTAGAVDHWVKALKAEREKSGQPAAKAAPAKPAPSTASTTLEQVFEKKPRAAARASKQTALAFPDQVNGHGRAHVLTPRQSAKALSAHDENAQLRRKTNLLANMLDLLLREHGLRVVEVSE